MSKEIIELTEDVSSSSLYSEDLAPVTASGRTWSVWSLAALWVGMAVCIPTYMLASSIILDGISWLGALIIIAIANVIITIPMVLSGHAGVKYGIPFPVLGRSSFGINGIHIPAIIRGLIAAVWFGIQTWIGGISIYAIWCVVTGTPISMGLDVAKFVGFGIFWLMNLYFIIKGTESIKTLEMLAAPILIVMGVALIGWGTTKVGSFNEVLVQSNQLKTPTLLISENTLSINPIKDGNGKIKAEEFQLTFPTSDGTEYTSDWEKINPYKLEYDLTTINKLDAKAVRNGAAVSVRLRKGDIVSNLSTAIIAPVSEGKGLWFYLKWLTAMVGFWATMSISIADITRYSKSQKDQIEGQFIGLPGTMILYSFVGIFVTCAAVVIFGDVLVRNDAPWDPAALLAKFDGVWVVIISQIFLLIATLSTNIAANVIAPANAFANAFPKSVSFKTGGVITALIGIIICPWWIINHIIPLLLFVSSLLGPVVAILICDYFVIRKTNLNLVALYQNDGEYAYGGTGYNKAAVIAFIVGVLFAGIGNFVPALGFLYDISWFSGFFVSFIIYYLLMKIKKVSV